MRAYIVTTSIVFGLLVLAHIARGIAEGPHVVKDPFFMLSTFVAAGLCVWACRLLMRRSS
jgi:hypothetical protein